MKIGILYNLVDRIERGFEIDALSDNEIVETVGYIQKVLEKKHEAVPVRIRRELLPMLTQDSFDFVFNLCEGIEGDVKGEALIPALLDVIKIPYTGADSLTLGLCLDKIKVKQLLIANNIPTPDYQMFHNSSEKLNRKLRFPLIVKPANEDASVGITVDSVVNNETDLFRGIEFILKNYHQPALVEEYIDGRELNVAILGNGNSTEVLPFSEIIYNFNENFPKILTYDAKWIADSEMFKKTTGVCPPPVKLTREVEEHIKKLAVSAYNITGCRDYARVDFRLKGNIPYVLEVNPNPAINVERDSGFVRSARVSGLSYDELIYRILSLAMERYKMKADSSGEKIDDAYTTNNLIAVDVKLKHIDILMEWFNNPEISKYMDMPDETYSREKLIEGFFVANRDKNFIIIEKESNKEIGYCSIYGINRSNQSAEFSYLIGEKQFFTAYGISQNGT